MKKPVKMLSLLLIATIMSLSGCKLDSASEHFVTTDKHESVYENVNTTRPFENIESSSDTTSETSVSPTGDTDVNNQTRNELKVHFIDVGQGDSSFIELPDGRSMLIDAGEQEYGDTVVTYIHSLGYDTIDYVVATHAHSDHIGGMTDVLNNFNINAFYTTEATSTTKTYKNMMNAVENNNIPSYNVMAGSDLYSSPVLSIEVVAPKELSNEDENDNSIIIKLSYYETKFLFTGDAEKAEEDGIWTNIKCDVLKVGHHGSNSSTSDNFLKKVEPTYAVISCGTGNEYGHPTDNVLNRLAKNNIKVYRTDTQGTIICTSDGTDISMNVNESENTQSTEISNTASDDTGTNQTITYVLNIKSKKIHFPDCSAVANMSDLNKDYTEDYDAAIAEGYEPCGICG